MICVKVCWCNFLITNRKPKKAIKKGNKYKNSTRFESRSLNKSIGLVPAAMVLGKKKNIGNCPKKLNKMTITEPSKYQEKDFFSGPKSSTNLFISGIATLVWHHTQDSHFLPLTALKSCLYTNFRFPSPAAH